MARVLHRGRTGIAGLIECMRPLLRIGPPGSQDRRNQRDSARDKVSGTGSCTWVLQGIGPRGSEGGRCRGQRCRRLASRRGFALSVAGGPVSRDAGARTAAGSRSQSLVGARECILSANKRTEHSKRHGPASGTRSSSTNGTTASDFDFMRGRPQGRMALPPGLGAISPSPSLLPQAAPFSPNCVPRMCRLNPG